MTPRLRGKRHRYTVAEFAALADAKPATVRSAIRSRRIQATDLNAGTGKRPNYRIPARELRNWQRG